MNVTEFLKHPAPSWMQDALCREYPDVSWFPAGNHIDCEAPKLICERCLVRTDCLAYALEHKLAHGIWGGITSSERRKHAAAPGPEPAA